MCCAFAGPPPPPPVAVTLKVWRGGQRSTLAAAAGVWRRRLIHREAVESLEIDSRRFDFRSITGVCLKFRNDSVKHAPRFSGEAGTKEKGKQNYRKRCENRFQTYDAEHIFSVELFGVFFKETKKNNI